MLLRLDAGEGDDARVDDDPDAEPDEVAAARGALEAGAPSLQDVLDRDRRMTDIRGTATPTAPPHRVRPARS